MKLTQNKYAVIFQNMKSEISGLTNCAIPPAPWNAIQQKKEPLSISNAGCDGSRFNYA